MRTPLHDTPRRVDDPAFRTTRPERERTTPYEPGDMDAGGWPSQQPARPQPGSRLNQALDVARRLLDQPAETWSEPFPQDRWTPAPATTATPPPPSAPVVHPQSPPASTPIHTIVDMRPREPKGPGRARSETDYGLGNRWGTVWDESAQGWVGVSGTTPSWRPIVTTTHELPEWEVDTYLGVITAEVAIEVAGGSSRDLGATLHKGREVGMEALVEEAIERGAHGVLGVGLSYTPFADRLLITLTGTAVTLRDRD